MTALRELGYWIYSDLRGLGVLVGQLGLGDRRLTWLFPLCSLFFILVELIKATGIDRTEIYLPAKPLHWYVNNPGLDRTHNLRDQGSKIVEYSTELECYPH